MIFDNLTSSGVIYLCFLGIVFRIFRGSEDDIAPQAQKMTRKSRLQVTMVVAVLAYLVKFVAFDKSSVMENHYNILGVHRSVSQADIKRGYKSMAIQYHPDKVQGTDRAEEAEEKFGQLTRVSEILQDDKKRDIYDRFGDDPKAFKFDPRQDPVELLTHVGIQHLLWGLLAYLYSSDMTYEDARVFVSVIVLGVFSFEVLVSMTSWQLPAFLPWTEHQVVLMLQSAMPLVVVAACSLAEFRFINVRQVTEDSLIRLGHVDNAVGRCMQGAMAALGEAVAAGGGKGSFAVVTTEVDEALKELDIFEKHGKAVVALLNKAKDEEMSSWISLGLFSVASLIIYHVTEYVRGQ